ncbi:hypothetical protein [Brevifollis gellanilyticus]|uniref:Uncharacterized protein n=1 Tax=Brevifollis gellanilyticus TaxID=748831 RepID=A0A512MAY9_9BACT|nr:hypothetical protein [Brevifollis gellanilyticus]GEP43906.1 hypothetical protein BGE01nite_31970 [Brevifollis gellanilyticus]
MKPSFDPIRRPLLVLTCCLGLASCKENQALQKQLDEANAKVQAVSQESIEIDKMLAANRREIPAYAGVGAAGANHYATQLAQELVNAESLVKQAEASLKDAETSLATAQKDLQIVKSKDPR